MLISDFAKVITNNILTTPGIEETYVVRDTLDYFSITLLDEDAEIKRFRMILESAELFATLTDEPHALTITKAVEAWVKPFGETVAVYTPEAIQDDLVTELTAI